MAYHVQQLWRYPVKSMAGESLERAEVLADGIVGDRLVVVHGPDGVLTSRTRPGLLSLHATLSPDGEPLIAHVPAGSDAAAALVRMVAGPDVELALLEAACAHVPVSRGAIGADGLVWDEGVGRQLVDVLGALAAHVMARRVADR